MGLVPIFVTNVATAISLYSITLAVYSSLWWKGRNYYEEFLVFVLHIVHFVNETVRTKQTFVSMTLEE